MGSYVCVKNVAVLEGACMQVCERTSEGCAMAHRKSLSNDGCFSSARTSSHTVATNNG
jgi:hypothetical protein